MSHASVLARTCGLFVAVGGVVALACGWVGAVPEAGPRFLAVACGATLAGVALWVSHRPAWSRALAVLLVLGAVASLGPAAPEPLADAASGDASMHRGVLVLLAIGLGLALAGSRLAPLSDVFALAVGGLAAGALVAGVTGVEGGGGDWLAGASALVAAPGVEAGAWLTLTFGLLLANTGPRSDPMPGWRPAVLAGVSAALLSGLLFQALSLREDQQQEAMLEVASRQIHAELASELRERQHALGRLAAEWEGRFFRLRGLWESDVRLVLSRSPGLAGIEWIDASGALGWTYPKAMPHPPPRLPDSAREAAAPRRLSLGPYRTGEGRFAFRVLIPVSRTDPGEGWLSGVFMAHDLFAGIAKQLPEGWIVAVQAGETELHRSPPDAPWVAGRTTDIPLEVLPGLPLRVKVGASPALLAQQDARLPETVLATGLVLSVLLALAIGLWRVTRGLAHQLESRVEERTASLARSNEGLRSFASFLSHELRQPVNAQTLWADVLESEFGSDLGEQGRRGLSEVRRLAHRMGELIEGQLELFALSSADVSFDPVDLEALLDEVSRDLKDELSHSDAKLVWESLPTVSGDRRTLHQLFRNLVDNSIKYARPRVSPSVRISALRRGENVEIRYRDEGRGFPSRDAERIFQIGVRVDPDGPPGHGLGLAMCRAIAERHGGTMSAVGWPGAGALFLIVLPAWVEVRDEPARRGAAA